MAKLEIRPDPISPELVALLTEHLEDMRRHSPPESVHALEPEGLRQPDLTFWGAWEGETLVGCAALRELDPRHGELKSMRTARGHLRRGIAAALLRHVLEEATGRGYQRLSLETGSMAAFEPARALYARFGFAPCLPFAHYVEDPNSVCMTRTL